MAERVRSFFAGANGYIAAFGLAGLIAAAFAALSLLSVLAGGVCRFRRAARALIKSPAGSVAPALKLLPPKAAEAYRLYKAAGERAGRLLSDAAVRLPYHTGIASKFFVIELAVSFAAAFIASAFLSFFAAITVYAAGAAFTAAAYFFSRFYYKSALKTCKKLVLVLDALEKSEKNLSALEPAEEEEAYVFGAEEEREGELYAVELEGSE